MATTVQITGIFQDIANRIPVVQKYDSLRATETDNFQYKIGYYQKILADYADTNIDRLKSLTEMVTLDDENKDTVLTWVASEVDALKNYVETYVKDVLDSTYTEAKDIVKYDLYDAMYNNASGRQAVLENDRTGTPTPTAWTQNTGSGTFDNWSFTQLSKLQTFRIECITATASGSETFTVYDKTNTALSSGAVSNYIYSDSDAGIQFKLTTTVGFAVGDYYTFETPGSDDGELVSFFRDYFEAVPYSSGTETISDSIIDRTIT